MDVTTAYLQGDLEEEVYVRPPKEIGDRQGGKVRRLQKAMYGLKQSGRAWNEKLDSVLKELKFNQSKADSCIYYQFANGKRIVVAIYVDAILVATEDLRTMNETKKLLAMKFKMRDLGEIKNFVGMKIERDRPQGKLWIDQSTYIKHLLEKFQMTDANPVSTPMTPNQVLSAEMTTETAEDRENEVSAL